jgi:putative nucleotidyltransferase with HDIG domain
MPFAGGEKENSGTWKFPLLWRQLQDVLSRRFSSAKTEKRDRFTLLLLTTLLLTLFITPDHHNSSTLYRAGQIAVADVRAGRDYLLEDHKLTAEKQAEAIAKVPLVYTFDDKTVESTVDRIQKALAFLGAVKSIPAGSEREKLAVSLGDILGVKVSPAELTTLLSLRDNAQVVAEIDRSLRKIYRLKVVADQRLFLSDQLSGITFTGPDGEKPVDLTFNDEPVDLEQARRLFVRTRFSASIPYDLQTSIKAMVASMLRPSLIFNREKTDEQKAAASSAVSPVLIQVKSGEMIVRDGDRVTAEQESKLEAMAAESSLLGRLSSATGVLGIVLVLLYFPYRFALKNIRKFRPSNKDLLLLVILVLGHFLLLKTLFAIAPTLVVAFPSVNTANYFYLFPFAATAIMVRIFINSEVALVYAAICAPLAGLMFESLPVVFYAMLGSIIGAHGVRHCDNRSIVFTAGLKVSVVNIAMALSFQLFNQSLLSMQTVYCLIFAFAGGIATAVLASGAIPLLESLFQYTTDIKLLELTNLNSPVLRELMVRAPGTYHHSVVVGNLVESAAEAINANPLLARVAAYYHDIGKISKAQYFIENQCGGENRHDKLAPSMSALILIAHVKEGAELARQHRLGQPIAEIIRQSHGTALIKYFYQKALEQAAPGQIVDEHEFRYPGPKPQTREAGLVLLADAVEAASRTLTDATPARIQGLVQKIINNIFIDGQLDECELTLKNLHQIAWSFNQILAGIYHQRIDYPQPAYKEKVPGARRHNEHSDNEPPKTPEGGDEEPQSGSCEDLKRLGMYF